MSSSVLPGNIPLAGRVQTPPPATTDYSLFQSTANAAAPARPPPTLNRVQPKNLLLCGPCPCERWAAKNRNKAVNALESRDIGRIALSYLQSRKGQYATRNEAIVWGAGVVVSTIATVVCTVLAPPSAVMAVMPVYWAPHTVANLGNTGRYRKTKRACKQALRDTLGAEAFRRLHEKIKSHQVDSGTKLHDEITLLMAMRSLSS